MMRNTCKYTFVQSAAIMFALLLLSMPFNCKARSKDKGNYTTLLKDPNMYAGKSSWLYTYKFFPEIDGRLVDSSKIHIPEEFFLHRFQLYAQGGYAGLLCPKAEMDFRQKMGLGGGINYWHFFSPHWGIKIGAGVNTVVSTVTMEGGVSDSYFVHDAEDDVVKYTYKVGGISEELTLYQVDFPLEVTYQKKKFNLGFGMKVGLPITVDCDQTLTDVVQTAYYPAYDVNVDQSWVLGCGSFAKVKGESKYAKSPVFIIATADMEWMFTVDGKNAIGIGIFADYSFCGISPSAKHNTMKSPASTSLIESLIGVSKSVPVELHSESVIGSYSAQKARRLAQSLKYVNYGIRISYCFNARPDKK